MFINLQRLSVKPRLHEASQASASSGVARSMISEVDALERLEQLWLASQAHDSDHALTTMLNSIDSTTAQKLLHYCDKLLGPERTNVLRPWLFGRLTELDPAHAVEYGEQFEFTDASTARVLGPLLSAWKEHDFAAVEAWYRKVKGVNVSPWLDSLFGNDYGKSKVPSRPIPSSLADAWSQSEALRNHVAGVTKFETVQEEPLVAWATANRAWESVWNRLNDGDQKDNDHRADWVLEEWGTNEYVGFLAWWKAHPSTLVGKRRGGISEAGQSWLADIRRNPSSEARINFMEQGGAFIAEYGKDFGMVSNLTDWLQEDPAAASAWLQRQNGKPWRDKLAKVLAEETIEYEPEGAMAWVQTIQEQRMRDEGLFSCWAKWQGLDPASADAWIKENVPDFSEIKARIKIWRH
jgi:hypothetical protein